MMEFLTLTTLCLSGLAAATFRGFYNSSGQIDTHIHALPPAYIDAINASGIDPSGSEAPAWSPEAAVASMDKFGTALGVLSVSSPGAPVLGTGKSARHLARKLNLDLGNYTEDPAYQGRLGFFGVLPDWRDINGTLAEIDFLFRRQKLCLGVTIYTSYGDMLPGNLTFRPIWAALQIYQALVFMHPSSLEITPEFIGNGLPQPLVDYPFATTRAAVDLVVSRTFRDHPDIDIILSHAGGTLPFLASRILAGFERPVVQNATNITGEEAAQDFQRFYLDTASSTSAAQLDGMLDFTSVDKILYGSDFPYMSDSDIEANIKKYEDYVTNNRRGILVSPGVLRANALKLLAKHSLAPGQRRNH